MNIQIESSSLREQIYEPLEELKIPEAFNVSQSGESIIYSRGYRRLYANWADSLWIPERIGEDWKGKGNKGLSNSKIGGTGEYFMPRYRPKVGKETKEITQIQENSFYFSREFMHQIIQAGLSSKDRLQSLHAWKLGVFLVQI